MDDSEVAMVTLSTLTNSYSAIMLTEDGLYEVLMQSRNHRGNKISKKDDTKDETLEEIIPKILKQC